MQHQTPSLYFSPVGNWQCSCKRRWEPKFPHRHPLTLSRSIQKRPRPNGGGKNKNNGNSVLCNRKWLFFICIMSSHFNFRVYLWLSTIYSFAQCQGRGCLNYHSIPVDPACTYKLAVCNWQYSVCKPLALVEDELAVLFRVGVVCLPPEHSDGACGELEPCRSGCSQVSPTT